MSNQESENARSPEAWEDYWQGAKSADAFAQGGAAHPGFDAFWTDALTEFAAARPQPRVLDIGTGSGAILDVLSKVDGIAMHEVTALDIAPSAIDGIATRHAEVNGVVSNAADMPFEDARFDLVVSQFGVEYARDAGIAEAARVLAPGGQLIAVLHFQMGALHQPSQIARRALEKLAASRFLDLAYAYFEAGFAAVRGGDRSAYEKAGKTFNPAIQALDGILSEYGSNVADGTLNYLYTTIETMHKRIQYFDADESLAWLRSARDEVARFRQRLDEMDVAACDPDGARAFCAALAAQDCNPGQPQPLMFASEPLPYGWAVQAEKRG